MKKITKIYLIPETCLECRYYQKFEYLDNGNSKPIEIKGGKVQVTLNSEGVKIFNGVCCVTGVWIDDGDELKKLYKKSMWDEKKECKKEFPIDECTDEQINSVL